MYANPPQLSKENSISCLQVIYVWAMGLEPTTERAQIIDALHSLATAMRLPPEKLEPGTRSAPVVSRDGCNVSEPVEKLEPGARSAPSSREGFLCRGQAPEKLEPGARSA